MWLKPTAVRSFHVSVDGYDSNGSSRSVNDCWMWALGQIHWSVIVCINLRWWHTLLSLCFCVSIQGKDPSEDAFQGQLRHKCSFFSLFLKGLHYYYPSWPCGFFVRPKKKKEREKMATSRGVDRHFRGPGRQKSWSKGKTKTWKAESFEGRRPWTELRHTQCLNQEHPHQKNVCIVQELFFYGDL